MSQPVPIYRREVYSTIISQYFKQGAYHDAIEAFTEGLAQWPDLESYDRCVIWMRIGNCAAELQDITRFRDAFDHYVDQLQATAVAQPEQLGTNRHDPQNLLQQAIHLYQQHLTLTEFIAAVTAHASTLADINWFGAERALESIRLSLFTLRTDLHYDHAHALAKRYLKLTDAWEQQAVAGIGAIYNLLADLEYLRGGEEGEQEALVWLERSLEHDATDRFALHQRRFLQERRVVQDQIRRFNHDTNTAIGSLNSALQQIILQQSQLPAPLIETVEQMRGDLQRIQQVNRLVQNQQPRYHTFNLIEQLRRWLAPQQQVLQIVWQISDDTIEIESDSGYLAIAFSNLIQNVVDAYQRRAIDPNHRPLTLAVHSDTDRIRIDLIDAAGGIDSKLRPRIFEPYVSSKGVQKETGLGLYQARHVIEDLLDGELKLATEQPPQGAHFVVELPRN